MRRAIRRRAALPGAPQRRCDRPRGTAPRGRAAGGSIRRCVELAVTIDGVAGEQRPHQAECHIGATPPSRRVDLADLHLVAILAADAHPDRETTGRSLSERRDLASCDHRMSQRQQVDTDMQSQPGFQPADRGKMDQPVDAAAVMETHVICGEDVVEPRVRDAGEASSLFIVRKSPEVPRRADPQLQCHAACRITIDSATTGPTLCNAVPQWGRISLRRGPVNGRLIGRTTRVESPRSASG